MTYTVRFARLAVLDRDTDAPRWPATYSPVWEDLREGTGCLARYATEEDAISDAISVLTDADRLPYTRPGGLRGWGTVIDIDTDPGRVERYAIVLETQPPLSPE